jgi:hypothetical protein
MLRWRLVVSATLLASVFLFLAGYGIAPAAARAQEKPTKSAISLDPCGLLTSFEIKSVQGEPVVEKKYAEQSGSSFLLRTCFYRTATFTKSVSLAIAVPGPSNAAASGPREFWEEHFHSSVGHSARPAAGERRPEGQEEQGERESKPVAVAGLGEEAYWIYDPHLGALYVLAGNCFLRISLGGKDNNSLRLDKTKSLARAALRRLKP